MSDFLSDQWFERLAATAATAKVEPPDLEITIEQAIADEPELAWHLVVSRGTVTLVHGPATRPDVRLTASRFVATGIYQGTISAPRAFLAGQLQIGGDIHRLLQARSTFVAIHRSSD